MLLPFGQEMMLPETVQLSLFALHALIATNADATTKSFALLLRSDLPNLKVFIPGHISIPVPRISRFFLSEITLCPNGHFKGVFSGD